MKNTQTETKKQPNLPVFSKLWQVFKLLRIMTKLKLFSSVNPKYLNSFFINKSPAVAQVYIIRILPCTHCLNLFSRCHTLDTHGLPQINSANLVQQFGQL